MAEKATSLSIVIRTVDQATAKIKAINERLDEAAKPTRDLKKAFGELAEKSGLSSVAEGFKGVGEAVKESLFKVLEVGAVIGEATHLVLELCESFETLGKTSERIGVTSDYLAGMRDAATRTGASVEDLDSGLEAFGVSLGKARAGTGRMRAFIEKVSPALERQLEATKSNAEAFDVLAGAMAKLKDPAKKSALAAATVGEKLAPLFAKGPKGLQELREHYFGLAGSQEEAVKSGTEVGESMKDLHATMDGIKAAIVEGLGPALKDIVSQLAEWFQGHREDIKEWAKQLGERIPGAVESVVAWVKKAVSWISDLVDDIGGWKNAAIGVAAFMAGPLIAAITAFGVALMTTPVGWITLGIAGISIAVVELIKHWDDLKQGFMDFVVPAPVKWMLDKFGPSAGEKSGSAQALMEEGKLDTVDEVRTDGDLPKRGDVVSDQARAALSLQPQSSSARITVDFANAPRGTRVSTDPKSSADVDLSMGYSMAAP